MPWPGRQTRKEEGKPFSVLLVLSKLAATERRRVSHLFPLPFQEWLSGPVGRRGGIVF